MPKIRRNAPSLANIASTPASAAPEVDSDTASVFAFLRERQDFIKHQILRG